MYLFLELINKKTFSPPWCYFSISSNEKMLKGQHFYTLDQAGIINAGDTRITVSAILRDYTALSISIVSDVDLTIDLQWSNDGSNYVSDSAADIFYEGSPNHEFFERAVKGVFLKYAITNTSIVDSTVFSMETYAQNSVNGDVIIIPPVPPVPQWWTRDNTDPAGSTFLVPVDIASLSGGGNVIHGTLSMNNRPSTTLDQPMLLAAFDTSGVNLNWQNLSRPIRNESFLGCFFAGNEGVVLNGPGIIRNTFMSNKGVIVGNTTLTQNTQCEGNTFIGCHDAVILNMHSSLIMGCNNDTYVRGSVTGAGIANIGGVFCNMDNSVFSDQIRTDPAALGTIFINTTVTRALNCQIYANRFEFCLMSGTRVYAPPLLTPPLIQGNCILTDNSAHTNTVLANFTQITAATGLMNTMHCRFASGYRFYTNSINTTGALLSAGSGVWASLCDVRFKTNLKEYTDTASILKRLVACKVQTYHNKYDFEEDPVKEGACFRITPTAQDFNSVFHPEEGNSDELIAASRDRVCKDYARVAETGLVEKRKKELGLDDMEELPLQEKDDIDRIVDEECHKYCETLMEKDSALYLNQQEYTAALHLSIKELSKQIDILKNRCAALEKA